MKTQLTEIERKDLVTYLLPFVNADFRELYQLKRATMIHSGKPWHTTGAKAQNLNEIKISELLQLSDKELQELKEKIDHAKLQKQVKTKQQRYFLK
jgi:uncharacterized protein (DUF342 family)